MTEHRTRKIRAPRYGASWQVSTLVRYALAAKGHHAIAALHWRGGREVFAAAVELCRSRVARRRRLGAQILGQLGIPERSFPEESLQILHGMLHTEKVTRVLSAVLESIGHCQPKTDMREIRHIARFSIHKNPRVRMGVVLALSTRDDRISLGTLARLSIDKDAGVRDWATFGLGTLTDVDNPSLRTALWNRVCDRHRDTRHEAIAGLARRKVSRIREFLVAELSGEDATTLIFEAAADYGDRTLLPYLERLMNVAKHE